MSFQLLEIQSRELKFIFEPRKQSDCSVQLVNVTDQHVAFKVKTTSPKKYCVRPNAGVILPNETCEFLVTMQAQRSAPPDMICRDKFLVQTTIVPAGTTEEDITSEMFSKDNGKYVEEKKLIVILVSPPHSPELFPVYGTGTPKWASPLESSAVAEELLDVIEGLSPPNMGEGRVKESRTVNNKERKPKKDANPEPIKQEESEPREATGVGPGTDVESELVEAVESIESDKEAKKTKKEVTDSVKRKNTKDLRRTKDAEEMKLKLFKLESKLSMVEMIVTKLTDERRQIIQEIEVQQRELALLRTSKVEKTIETGYPLLLVCVVALIGIVLGYSLHP